MAYSEHDLSNLLVRLHVSIRFDDCVERKGLGDFRLEFSGVEAFVDVAPGSRESLWSGHGSLRQPVATNSQRLCRAGTRGNGVSAADNQPYSTIIAPRAAASASWPSSGPPIGSKMIRAPTPPVMSLTRDTKSSSSVTITWFAPSASSSPRLAPVRVVAMETAPSAFTV